MIEVFLDKKHILIEPVKEYAKQIKKNYINLAVDVITLDSLCDENYFPKPYLLKIDIDGLELEVLKGAKNT